MSSGLLTNGAARCKLFSVDFGAGNPACGLSTATVDNSGEWFWEVLASPHGYWMSSELLRNRAGGQYFFPDVGETSFRRHVVLGGAGRPTPVQGRSGACRGRRRARDLHVVRRVRHDRAVEPAGVERDLGELLDRRVDDPAQRLRSMNGGMAPMARPMAAPRRPGRRRRCAATRTAGVRLAENAGRATSCGGVSVRRGGARPRPVRPGLPAPAGWRPAPAPWAGIARWPGTRPRRRTGRRWR